MINDKINQKIETEKEIFNDFELLWDEYDQMTKLRRVALNQLKKTKLKLTLDTFLTHQHPQIMIKLYSLDELLDEKINIIKNEQELLNIINKNIMRLQLYKITDFNNEITTLINLIKYKNDCICSITLKYIKLSLKILKGYDIDNNIENINTSDIDNKIDEYSLKLGLN